MAYTMPAETHLTVRDGRVYLGAQDLTGAVVVRYDVEAKQVDVTSFGDPSPRYIEGSTFLNLTLELPTESGEAKTGVYSGIDESAQEAPSPPRRLDVPDGPSKRSRKLSEHLRGG